MKSTIIVFFIFLPFLVFSQNTLSKSEQETDLKFTYDLVSKLHPALKNQTTHKKFHNTYLALSNRTLDSTDIFEFSENIGKLVSSIGCGHTAIHNSSIFTNMGVKGVPFLFEIIDNKIVSKFSLVPDLIPSGSEIVSIQNIPIEIIKNKIISRIGGVDNFIQSGIDAQSARMLPKYYEYIYGKTDSLMITFIENGNTKNTIIPILGIDSLNKSYLNKDFGIEKESSVVRKLNVPESNILHWKIRMFSYHNTDIFGSKLRKNLKRNFKYIKNQNPDGIIIDLRGNPGGNVKSAVKFLRYFAKEPFYAANRVEYHKDVYPELSKLIITHSKFRKLLKKGEENGDWIGVKKGKWLRKRVSPVKDNFKNTPTVFLINGGTFSAGTMVANKLKEFGYNSYGTETGGAQWGSYAGIFKTITLPHSKIRMSIPLVRKENSGNLEYQGGVLPTNNVKPTLENIKYDQDVVLKKAIEYLSK